MSQRRKPKCEHVFAYYGVLLKDSVYKCVKCGTEHKSRIMTKHHREYERQKLR